LDYNLAGLLKALKTSRNLTLPFTDKEAGKIPGNASGKTKIFIHLLLHTGWRISDAAVGFFSPVPP
jgi:hypothetical protein